MNNVVTHLQRRLMMRSTRVDYIRSAHLCCFIVRITAVVETRTVPVIAVQRHRTCAAAHVARSGRTNKNRPLQLFRFIVFAVNVKAFYV